MLEKIVFFIATGVFSILSVIAGFTFKDLYRRLLVVETHETTCSKETAIEIVKIATTLENSNKLIESLTQEVRLLSQIVMMKREYRRFNDEHEKVVE